MRSANVVLEYSSEQRLLNVPHFESVTSAVIASHLQEGSTSASRKPMEDPWKMYGRPMEQAMETYGRPMEDLKSSWQRHWVSHWAQPRCGSSVLCRRTLQGRWGAPAGRPREPPALNELSGFQVQMWTLSSGLPWLEWFHVVSKFTCRLTLPTCFYWFSRNSYDPHVRFIGSRMDPSGWVWDCMSLLVLRWFFLISNIQELGPNDWNLGPVRLLHVSNNQSRSKKRKYRNNKISTIPTCFINQLSDSGQQICAFDTDSPSGTCASKPCAVHNGCNQPPPTSPNHGYIFGRVLLHYVALLKPQNSFRQIVRPLPWLLSLAASLQPHAGHGAMYIYIPSTCVNHE